MIYALGLIAFIVAIILEIRTSAVEPMKEGNFLWRNKYGQFDLKKYLIIMGILGGVIGVVGLLSAHEVWYLYPSLGVPILINVYFNYRTQKAHKIAQTEFLSKLVTIHENNGTPLDITMAFNDQLMVTASNRTWYQLFPLIYEEGQPDQVKETLQRRILELALRW